MATILILVNVVFFIVIVGVWIKIGFTDRQVNRLKEYNYSSRNELNQIHDRLNHMRDGLYAQEHGLKLEAYYIVKGEIVKASDSDNLTYIADHEHKEINPEKWQ